MQTALITSEEALSDIAGSQGLAEKIDIVYYSMIR